MEVREPSAKYLAKAAYKQTEVGLIPEDWQCITTAELVEPDAPICYGVVQVGRNTDNGVPIVAIKYVKAIAYAPLHRTALALERPYSRSRVRRGDVLISIKGTIGRVGVVPTGFKGNISRELARLRPRPEYSGAYVAHQLEAGATQARISKEVVGTTRLEFSIATLRKFVLAFPGSLPEQQAIAEALSDADALTEALEQLLAKKHQIKQGAMQELLTGQKRLPGFAGEWVPTPLGAIGEFFKGSGIKRDEAQSGTLPCVRYGEIYTTHNDHIRVFDSWISAEVAENATRLRQGDLLFAGSGETKEEIGKCVAFLDDIEAYGGGDIVILRPRGFDSLFLGYALNTAEVNRQKASRGQGDAVVHISAAALAQVVILAPEPEEQSAIATVLSDMDAEIAALEAKLAKARQIKQGMMAALLTGRIRLV